MPKWHDQKVENGVKVYRRLHSKVIKSAVLLLFAAAALGVLLAVILRNARLAAIIAIGVYVPVELSIFLFHGNVRFELEVGRLRYYKTGRLRGNYFLSTCKFRTHIDCDYDRAGNIIGSPGLELFVSDVSDYSGDEILLNCTPIGLAQFRELIDELRLYYERTSEPERQGYRA